MVSRISFPFYRIDELTNALTPLAMHVLYVANIAQRYLPDPDDNVCGEMSSTDMREFVMNGVLEYSKNETERYAWIAQDFVMRDLARWIATDNFEAQGAFLVVGQQYARCFGPVGKQKQLRAIRVAQIHTLAAAIKLAETFDRDQVTKAQIRRLACRLWTAGYKLRGQNGKLPEVQWRRVYRALGLDDLRAGPNSRTFDAPSIL